jgi:hypothetical protein
LARVITVDHRDDGQKVAWALDLLREGGRLETDDGFIITRETGQNSALDSSAVSRRVEVGNVVVQQRSAQGELVDYPYGVDFLFVCQPFFLNGEGIDQ